MPLCDHSDAERGELIKFYFNLGLSFCEIAVILAQKHSIIISERHLKRCTKKLGLYRRKNPSDILSVAEFIKKETDQSGQLHGYRWMHLKCIQGNLVVSQETVRLLLNLIDPEGIKLRKHNRLRRRQYSCKGPNHTWHIDGYDKLKHYGICIHGCIDGFSRSMVWLEAFLTNNDPKIIAGYYLKAIKVRKGGPVRIRADCGTENGHVEQIHTFLMEGTTARNTANFIYGKSTRNQRIEMWWSILRKENCQFWMNVFEDIKNDDKFSGDFLDKSLIQFCFMELIQNELDEVATIWNTHKIRNTRHQRSPCGRPLLMYYMPELYSTRDYLVPFENEKILLCEDEIVYKGEFPCDEDVFELCCMLMEENNWEAPLDASDGVELYLLLRNAVKQLL